LIGLGELLESGRRQRKCTSPTLLKTIESFSHGFGPPNELCDERNTTVTLISNTEELLFEVITPLDFTIRVTASYWDLIVTIKHPVMAGHESSVKKTLESPEQIRVSRSDPEVFLFYKIQSPGRLICAVAKKLDGEGFLVTAYPTDAIKEGEYIWPK